MTARQKIEPAPRAPLPFVTSNLEFEENAENALPSAPDDLSLRIRGCHSATHDHRTKPAGLLRRRRPILPKTTSLAPRHRGRPATLLSRGCDTDPPWHVPSASSVNTGDLFMLSGSRPAPRALAQIVCRSTRWPLNKTVVGRGASLASSGRHFTSSTRNATQGRGKCLSWKSAKLPPHLIDRSGPFAILSTSSPPLGEQEVTAPEAQYSGQEPATSPARPAMSAEQEPGNELEPGNKLEPGNEQAPRNEQAPENELDRIRSKLALWDADRPRHVPTLPTLPTLQQSDTIHIMGLNPTGRYIAHTLAGCETIPPVRFILGKYHQYRQWVQHGKRMTLYRGDTRIDRLNIEAEFVPERVSEQQEAVGSGDIIHNLIVTVTAGGVVRALGPIAHRLNHNSTICLVNDGLGVAEALVDAYFPNQLTRPVFLLGHFTTSLDYTGSRFSVAEVRPGRLYLSLFAPQANDIRGQFRVKRHPPLERTSRATHFIRLLTAMPGLHATGHSIPEFLRHKLPRVAFKTVVEPLAALFDCRYIHLPNNRPASILMDHLIGELSSVVSRLPECRESEKLRQYTLTESLRRDVFRRLARQRTADSPMRAQIERGWDTDIDFLAGYFVKRGREVNARITVLEAVMWSVRAKENVLLHKLANEIAFKGAETFEGPGGPVPAHYFEKSQVLTLGGTSL